MDNKARSERSRNAAINAALTIIARDGPGRLTLDAIARESGISKGGVTHQFRTKADVLRALLQNQIDYFDSFRREYQGSLPPGHGEATLSGQLAVLREAGNDRNPAVFALVGAVAEAPVLMDGIRERQAQELEAIRQEAADPDLATLRWAAAWGLMLTSLLKVCPLDPQDRERLFARLLDAKRWPAGG